LLCYSLSDNGIFANKQSEVVPQSAGCKIIDGCFGGTLIGCSSGRERRVPILDAGNPFFYLYQVRFSITRMRRRHLQPASITIIDTSDFHY